MATNPRGGRGSAAVQLGTLIGMVAMTTIGSSAALSQAPPKRSVVRLPVRRATSTALASRAPHSTGAPTNVPVRVASGSVESSNPTGSSATTPAALALVVAEPSTSTEAPALSPPSAPAATDGPVASLAVAESGPRSTVPPAAPSPPAPDVARARTSAPVAATTSAPPAAATPVPASTTTVLVPPGWRETFFDDFTNGLGPAWTAVTTGSGLFDDPFPIGCYTPGQVHVVDGVLRLSAERKASTCLGHQNDYSSGLVTTRTKFFQQYGRFEARMRTPVIAGTWPAWWLMPERNIYGYWPLSGEIDIMEYVGNSRNDVYQTVHYPVNGQHAQDGSGAKVDGTVEDWHRYAIEWDATSMRWFVDDVLVKTWNTTGAAPFDQPFYLVLNLALGGEWAGPPADGSLPATLEVDWVRVWER